MIHPTAIIEEGAVLGQGCQIHAYAVLRRHAVLGDHVVVHPFAVVGGDPQYLRFDPSTLSKAEVGSGSILREHVTVNRSIYPGKATRVGTEAFLMANTHVGHDCEVGNKVVLANNVMLAGHVTVGEASFLGGGAAIHQFVRIGAGAMIGGATRLTRDVPPNTLVNECDALVGLNLIGLNRRGLSREVIRELKQAFREVCLSQGNLRHLARAALESGRYLSPQTKEFLSFFEGGKRGFVRARRLKREQGEESE